MAGRWDMMVSIPQATGQTEYATQGFAETLTFCRSTLLCRLPPAFAGISASTPGALAIAGRDKNEKVAIKQAAAEDQKHEKEEAAHKDAKK